MGRYSPCSPESISAWTSVGSWRGWAQPDYQAVVERLLAFGRVWRYISERGLLEMIGFAWICLFFKKHVFEKLGRCSHI